MASDEGYSVWNTNPAIEMVQYSGGKCTARTGVQRVIGSKSAVVFEEYECDRLSRVIPDGISLRELRVVFYDKKETDISVFVVWSDCDVIDSYRSRMMEYCLSN